MAKTARPADPGVEIVTEAGEDLSGVRDWLAASASVLVSALTEGARGRIASEVLIQAGYAREEDLMGAYRENPEAIENYFNAINTRKLLLDLLEKKGGGKGEKSIFVPTVRDGVAAAAGSLLTIAAQQTQGT